MNNKQLPGFSTLKIDQYTQIPYDLEMTVLDITKTYGLNEIPFIKTIPNQRERNFIAQNKNIHCKKEISNQK